MNDTQDSMEDEEQERIKIDEKVESLAWLQQQFKDQLRSSQLNKMSQSFKSFEKQILLSQQATKFF